MLTSVFAYKVKHFDNGLTLIYKKYNDSNVVAVDFWVKTGSLYENNENNGASHFMEHMFFKGTKKRPGNIADYIKALGATYNGATSQDYVHYFIEAPKDKLAESIDILTDMLANVDLTEKKFNEEKGVILSELATRKSEPFTNLFDSFGEVIFDPTYPYSRPIGGDYDVVKQMTLDDLKYFYKHFYTKDRITVVVAGNFDEESLVSLTKEKTANINEAGEKVEFDFNPPAPISKPKIVKKEMHTGGIAYSKIGWIGTDALSDDFPALLMLGYVLSGGESSRLDQEIVTTGLASSIMLDFSASKLINDFGFVYVTSPDNVDKVKDIILSEVKKISNGDITNEELERMKILYESSFEMSKERPISLASTLGFYNTVANLDLYDNIIKRIRRIEVDDIVRVCRKYLGSNNYAFLTILPEDSK
ncbi:MAG: pitrilysin family protein [Deferribacterota bacterium]|nr:pitrilysin family protein [Deferribacterota bacterium]